MCKLHNLHIQKCEKLKCEKLKSVEISVNLWYYNKVTICSYTFDVSKIFRRCKPPNEYKEVFYAGNLQSIVSQMLGVWPTGFWELRRMDILPGMCRKGEGIVANWCFATTMSLLRGNG